MRFPLDKQATPSRDSWSFAQLDLAQACPLPLAPHPGAFAVERSRHVHEGVDLYGVEGDAVSAIEDSRVVAIIEFTGPAAGSAWWLPTQAVLAEGAHGVWVYGELRVRDGLKVGDALREGDRVGRITQVLAKDKGRPTCMLHIELRAPGSSLGSESWDLNAQKPWGLLDPTPALALAAGWAQLAEALADGDARGVDDCLAQKTPARSGANRPR